MQFLIIINSDEKAETKATVEQQKEVYEAYMKYTADLKTAGVLLGGEALEPSAKGARVGWKDGRQVVVDGPFTEAKEVVGGYYLIDVKSREEAIEWAAKCPGSRFSPVEVRSVMIFNK
ncbi:MAG: YciI family protein [Labilithrix sp.]|nr:YciI family protein [Labilithrix sp.]